MLYHWKKNVKFRCFFLHRDSCFVKRSLHEHSIWYLYYFKQVTKNIKSKLPIYNFLFACSEQKEYQYNVHVFFRTFCSFLLIIIQCVHDNRYSEVNRNVVYNQHSLLISKAGTRQKKKTLWIELNILYHTILCWTVYK